MKVDKEIRRYAVSMLHACYSLSYRLYSDFLHSRDLELMATEADSGVQIQAAKRLSLHTIEACCAASQQLRRQR